jgi:hypothetical protein
MTMAANPDTQLRDRTAAQVVSIMTTEHFALQGARSSIISDANGRSALFLGSVSTTLVALALVAQASHLGTAFHVFSLVLFPTLFFLGVFTFQRVLQSGVEDTLCARGINRIRHFYVEVAPQMADYFTLSTHDDAAGFLLNMAVGSSPVQLFRTTSGMLAVINSVLGGVFVGFLVAVVAARSLALATGTSIAIFLLSLFVHQRYQQVTYRRADQTTHVLFPTPTNPSESSLILGAE